jgi:hypothetical protein
MIIYGIKIKPLYYKMEVVRFPQEGRTYYCTTFTEKVGEFPNERYFTTNPLTYVGKYIGSRSEGWGTNQKEWSYFINDQNEEIEITHTSTTAFYYKQDVETKIIKELSVVRKPVEGKYYEATFWTRKEGHWSAERYFTRDTTAREYVGKYLRHKREGWGDGAEHWAIFLRDGKEIEMEYDYEGKRAWREVDNI